MESESPSPLTRASWGIVTPFTGNPSIRAISGSTESALRAKSIARWVARRTLISSITWASSISTAHTTSGFLVISTYRSSLRFFVSFLESSSSGHEKGLGRMTAAAATGPARGPLPASSTPAIRAKPRVTRSSSKAKSGTGYQTWLKRFPLSERSESSAVPNTCVETTKPLGVVAVPIPVYVHLLRILRS